MSARPDTIMRQYTIYCRPSDFPDWYVLRGWNVCKHGCWPDNYVELFDTVEQAREALSPDLVCLGRQADDDPTIVETWI